MLLFRVTRCPKHRRLSAKEIQIVIIYVNFKVSLNSQWGVIPNKM